MFSTTNRASASAVAKMFRNVHGTSTSATSCADVSACARGFKSVVPTTPSATSCVGVSALADQEGATSTNTLIPSNASVSATQLWSELRYLYTSHDMVGMLQRKTYQKWKTMMR